MNKVLNAQNAESYRSRPPESKVHHDRDGVEIMRDDVQKLHPSKVCSGAAPRAVTSGRVALLTQERVARFLLLAGLLVLLPVSGLAQSLITTYAGGMLPIEGALATTQSIGSPGSVISDRAGGFYFSTVGPSHHRVYRVSFDGALRAIAGDGTQGFGGDGGPALSAQLNDAGGLALDGSGNLFIADSSNNRIRKVTPAGIISTVAGTGAAGFNGDGGLAISALLSFPADIALDSSGALYISDGTNRIRKVSPAGTISTVAGTGTFGSLGDGGQATSARLGNPRGIAVDPGGNIFIADSSNYRVRRVATNGVITTIAGNGSFNANPTGDGGPATSASLSRIDGIALDASGTLFIAASGNARIRKVADGIISTVAGNGSFGFDGDGGPATSARLASPAGIGVDATGNLFIADSFNNRIRKVTPAGIISTVAGNGILSFGGDGGPATLAALSNPNGIALDSTGNLFIADSSNSRIRKVTPLGIISSFAADLYLPGGVAVDSAGNVFTTDCDNSVIKTTPAGVVTTFSSTWIFCSYYYYYYDFSNSGGVAVDSSGNLFVADAFNNRVHKLTPDGTISLVAGTGLSGSAGDGGPATSARLNLPSGVAVDATGNLFIADSHNNRIRKVSPDGVITTFAGNGSVGFSGDGGPATSARLVSPNGVAVDAAGNLYIADTGNNRIRKVTPSGIISTIAGNGTPGFSGDGGAATSAQLNSPASVTLDAVGNLFISDSGNNRIRRVGVALTVPTLSSLSRNIGARGTSFNVTLAGTSFASPLTIDAGSEITVSNVTVVNDLLATATFTVASNAAEGARNVKVTTSLGTSGNLPFAVVPPYPDLSITSSHTGNLAVGFDATYVVGITNVGSAHTTGPLTVTDVLPAGLTYVSGEGNGWSCASAAQIVTCENPNTLPAGASTNLNLTVAVGGSASAGVIHAPVVSSAGDLTLANNATSDLTIVAVPAVGLRLTPQNLLPGGQVTVDLTVPTAFPQDVTGTLTLGFSSDAVNPADDPAIQFETGGRVVAFTIPANTLQARFGVNPGAPAIGFQTGTVSGTVSLNGTLQTGAVQTPFSGTATIPRQAPKIHSIQNEPSGGGNGFKVGLILSSTLREVTQLIVRFQTTPQVRLDCGPIAGCVSTGNTFTLDVRAMFDGWFVGDTVFGSLSSLHVPFFVDRTVHGSVIFSLTNRIGTSNSMTFEIP